MITVIISAFLLLVVVGAVADALWSEKAKEVAWLRYVLAAIPSPYNLMRLYSRMGDNLDDFTRAHAVSGMGYLGIMLIVSAFAWWADQQVLYGLEYAATRNESFAWWQSAGIATIIQAILIFNGGMAIKLAINGKRQDPDHNIQFKIHTLLGVIAFSSTLWLSFQTYESAMTRGEMAEKIVKQEIHTEADSIGRKYGKQMAKLKARFAQDSTRAEANYKAQVGAAHSVFVADSIRKAKDLGRNKYQTRQYVDRRIASFRIKRAKAMQAANERRQQVFDSLAMALDPQVKQLENAQTNMLLAVESKLKDKEANTKETVEKNAGSTRGKNIILNIIAFFFNLGLQFFTRGANAAERAKRLKEQDQQTATESDDFLEPKPVVEVKAPKVVKVVKVPEKAKGGTIEANKELKSTVLENGEICILYNGLKGQEWWSWSKCRAALKNRVNKFQKAKGEKSKATQLEWIRLIENKMDFIEESGQGKKRQPFDPKRPEKELF